MRIHVSSVRNFRCEDCRTLHVGGWPNPDYPCCDGDGNPINHGKAKNDAG